jgi:hypothetical protein
LWVAAAGAAALAAAFACNSRPSDVHDSDDVKGKPCFSCHSAAYNAAVNPRHVDSLPQTCQDCHGTKAWVPTTTKDHPYWPILNKHVGVSCAACHTKGYKVGDTPKDCLGCHRKDYDSALNPNAGFPKHVDNGADQYPLDCTTCHTDMGFKPSPWKHVPELVPGATGLVGHHAITPCVGCHTGTPPKYKGTPTDCYQCHQADADTRAPAKNPNHTTFPHACLNCHLMSGWTQGPPLSGLHPEAKFPLQTGMHADPRIVCLDCHKLEKGLAAGGGNVDCINCHLGGTDHHVSPAIDAYHAKTPDGGTVPGYPQGSSTTNFCLGCHAQGQHL